MSHASRFRIGSSTFFLLFAAGLLTALLVVPAGAVRAAVTFQLDAAPTSVEPGDTVVVDIEVPVAGDEFNGYDAILSFDAFRLEPLLPSPPSAGEGALFTEACGLRFLDVSDDGDSSKVRVSHVVLCAGLSLTGPGTVYTLSFIAKPVPGLAVIELTTGTQAYDAGFNVPTTWTDPVVITIGDVTAAPPARLRTPELDVVPNPFNPATEIRFELGAPSSARLEIFDVSGRRVRALHEGPLTAGLHRFRWDGRDMADRAVASGLYFARLHTRVGEARARLVLIR